MSTRGYVGIINGENVRFVYNHNDSDLKTLGIDLFERYGTVAKVEEVLAEGDTSYWGENPYHDGSPMQEMTLDELLADIEESDIEFVYLIDEETGKWSVRSCHTHEPWEEYDLFDVMRKNGLAMNAGFLDMYQASARDYVEASLASATEDKDSYYWQRNMSMIKQLVKEDAEIRARKAEEARAKEEPKPEAVEPKKEEITDKDKEKPSPRKGKAKEFDVREWQKKKDDEMSERLTAGIEKVYSSEEWANFLHISQNFAKYSVSNKILVFAQCPEATFVKGKATWAKEYEREVNPDAKPIWILGYSPYTKMVEVETVEQNSYLKERVCGDEVDGKVPVRFDGYKSLYVFDVSQTSGKELPPHEVAPTLTGKVENIDEILRALVEASPCPVEWKTPDTDDTLKHACGYYSIVNDSIVVNSEMSEEMMVKTLAHEIAHSLLHGKEMRVEGLTDTTQIADRSIREVQAESVAFMVCDRLGIDSGSRSFGYVASYLADVKAENEGKIKNGRPAWIDVLQKNLQTIETCATLICNNFEKALENTQELEVEEPEM